LRDPRFLLGNHNKKSNAASATFGQLQASREPGASHHEINKAFERRNYKSRRKYCSAKIKQFTQGFALLFIKQ